MEDDATGATDFEFFYNAVRNEIEKANRHGRCFSILEVEIGPLDGLRAQFGDVAFRQWIAKAVAQLTRLQRSSDLLSIDGLGKFLVLLPETDALGAAMFKRRAFDELQAGEVLALLGPKSRAKIHVAAASYPSDGTQLESLLRLLDERIENDGSSLVREWVLDDKPIAACLESLLEGGVGRALRDDCPDHRVRSRRTHQAIGCPIAACLRRRVRCSARRSLLDWAHCATASDRPRFRSWASRPNRTRTIPRTSAVQWASGRELGEPAAFPDLLWRRVRVRADLRRCSGARSDAVLPDLRSKPGRTPGIAGSA